MQSSTINILLFLLIGFNLNGQESPFGLQLTILETHSISISEWGQEWLAYCVGWSCSILMPIEFFTCGNSGGARMTHNLAFIYQENCHGAMPLCRRSYISEEEQDYETQNPNGHYGALLPYATSYLDYLNPLD